MDSCEKVIDCVQMLSRNFVDFSVFVRDVTETLEIARPEQKNRGFILRVVKELREFAVREGHPQLTSKKKSKGEHPSRFGFKKENADVNFGFDDNHVISENSFNMVKNTFNEYIRRQ